jgi:hypothetical protein
MNATTFSYLHIAAMTCAIAVTAQGCALRDARTFVSDTQSVTAPKQEVIRACHTQALKSNPSAAGLVVVNFTWEKDTGKMTNLVVVPGQTTAPAELQTCVTKNLEGLLLQPPDKQTATITWSYDFTVPKH